MPSHRAAGDNGDRRAGLTRQKVVCRSLSAEVSHPRRLCCQVEVPVLEIDRAASLNSTGCPR
jgi:hypothetical protein